MISPARRFVLFPLTRLVIAALIFGIAAVVLGAPFALLLHPNDPLRRLLAQEIVAAAAALAALFGVGLLIERRRPSEFGFEGRRAPQELAIGFALAAALMSAIIGVLRLGGWYRVLGRPLDVTGTDLFLAFVLCFFIAVFEEVLFRGVLFRILEEWIGSWGAILVSGLIFGLVHWTNPNATALAGIAIAIEAGVLLAAAYMLTRRLWLAVGLHWAWNWFQGSVYDAPVSGQRLPGFKVARIDGPALLTGGDFGPEAGLVALVIAGGVGFLLLWLALRRGRGVAPAWKRSKTVAADSAPEAVSPSSPR